MAGPPSAWGQSESKVCETYRASYDYEQEKINRMPAGVYRSRNQERLDEKRARLEKECGQDFEEPLSEDDDPDFELEAEKQHRLPPDPTPAPPKPKPPKLAPGTPTLVGRPDAAKLIGGANKTGKSVYDWTDTVRAIHGRLAQNWQYLRRDNQTLTYGTEAKFDVVVGETGKLRIDFDPKAIQGPNRDNVRQVLRITDLSGIKAPTTNVKAVRFDQNFLDAAPTEFDARNRTSAQFYSIGKDKKLSKYYGTQVPGAYHRAKKY
jgi:hypothetical protein